MRTFRDSWTGLVIGVIFITVPIAVFSIPALWHLITGEPMMISDFSRNIGPHAATQAQVLTMIVMPLVLPFFGVLSILSWNKKVTQTDENGIRRFGPRGELRFEAKWSEIRSVSKQTSPKGRTTYILKSESGRMDFPGTTTHLAELLKLIRIKSPSVEYASWD